MQHRANALPETVESIEGGYPPTLKIYRIPASRYWYVRCWMANKMITRSLKTEIKTEAIRGAKAFFNDLVLKRAKQEPLTQSPTFKLTAEALFTEDEARVNRGERKQSVVDGAKYIYKADLLKFFNKYHVKDINYTRINEYVVHLQESRGDKPISSKTIKNHFIVLNKILKQAHKLGYLDKLPIFPSITVVDNARGWFTQAEYDKLIKTIEQLVKDKTVVRFNTMTDEILHIVTFLVNSYLRPPDLKELKNKHIEKVTNANNVTFLRIWATSKTKSAAVIANKPAIGIYEQLLKAHKPESLGEPEDYVFFPALKKNRGYAMDTMRLQFNHALAVSELKAGQGGQPRTLYSLRHTCIMRRLLHTDNIDLLTLARNCRTSVDMISRFYGSHLTAEMNAEKLLTKTEPTEIYSTFDDLYAQEEEEAARRLSPAASPAG